MSDLSRCFEVMREHARLGGRLLVMSDFDGTLAPFVIHPDAAALAPGIPDVLGRLSRNGAARVAVISSRGLEDLRRHVDIPGVDLLGSHGLETLGDTGRVLLADLPPPSAELIRIVEREVRALPGAWLEVKPLGLAVHVRGLNFDQRIGLEQGIRNVSGVLDGVDGKGGWIRCRYTLEWMPAGAGKDFAVRYLLEHWQAAPGDLPLYAGDDENDSAGLREIRARGGLALGVGPQPPPEAEYLLRDPGELALFLRIAAGNLGA